MSQGPKVDLSELNAPEEVVHTLVTRAGWGAQEPKGELKPLTHPVKYIVKALNTKVACCTTKDECKARMLELQRSHMSKGMPDMHYNFAVGGDGNLYEGRGWDYQPESFKENPEWDERGISVAYLGDLEDVDIENPFARLIDIIYLANYGVSQGYVEEDYEMVEDKQTF